MQYLIFSYYICYQIFSIESSSNNKSDTSCQVCVCCGFNSKFSEEKNIIFYDCRAEPENNYNLKQLQFEKIQMKILLLFYNYIHLVYQRWKHKLLKGLFLVDFCVIFQSLDTAS